jgi:hypothetical protein
MMGTFQLLRNMNPEKESTKFLNIASLGSGEVAMVGSEGWARPIHSSDELVDLGYLIGSTAGLPLALDNRRQRRSETAMARSMGYSAMTLKGLMPSGRAEFRCDENMLVPKNLDNAAIYIRGMIRSLDEQA